MNDPKESDEDIADMACRVLTVASLALAEAGYRYNAPSASFGLPGNQPANFHPGQGSQQQIILPNEFDQPISNVLSFKDYVYLKQINNENHGIVNHGSNNGFVAGPTVQVITGQSVNGGYVNAGYAQNFAHHAPTANFNNNYAHYYPHVNSHGHSGQIQHISPVTSGNTNTGYSQSTSVSGSHSNVGYVHNPISSTTGSSTGYPLTSSASALNINNGYAHTSVPAANNNFNVGNVHTFNPSTNLNSGYSYAPAPNANRGLNHGYANSAIHSTSSNLNTGYSHTSGSENLSNSYSTSSASSTLDTGHSQILAPSGITKHSNSYAQSSIPSINVKPINSYSEPVAISGSVGLNHGYPQASVSSASGNLNNGYAQTQVQAPYSSSSSTYNDYSQISTASASDDSNNDVSYKLVPYSNSYSTSHTNTQTSAGTDTNLNTGYSQILSPTVSSSSNTGYSETSVPLAVDGINNYNTDFSHSQPTGTVSASHGFANNVVPAGPVLNTEYSQTTDPNFNTGSSQSFSSDGTLPHIDAQLNNEHGTPVSSSLSNSYSEISNSPLKVDLNPISTFDTINSGSVQTSTGSSNLNIGFTQTGSSNHFNGNAVGGLSSAAIAPAVYKHIYLHVPPPDLEEQSVVPPPPPVKKNYKIIFIKVPSQESRANLARINQIAENINAASSIEHKTLIYVLVKNPEIQQPVVFPNQTPSEHEVFFLKYNGDPIDIAAQVKDELDKTGAVQSIVPLEQGLVNSKK